MVSANTESSERRLSHPACLAMEAIYSHRRTSTTATNNLAHRSDNIYILTIIVSDGGG